MRLPKLLKLSSGSLNMLATCAPTFPVMQGWVDAGCMGCSSFSADMYEDTSLQLYMLVIFSNISEWLIYDSGYSLTIDILALKDNISDMYQIRGQ